MYRLHKPSSFYPFSSKPEESTWTLRYKTEPPLFFSPPIVEENTRADAIFGRRDKVPPELFAWYLSCTRLYAQDPFWCPGAIARWAEDVRPAPHEELMAVMMEREAQRLRGEWARAEEERRVAAAARARRRKGRQRERREWSAGRRREHAREEEALARGRRVQEREEEERLRRERTLAWAPAVREEEWVLVQSKVLRSIDAGVNVMWPMSQCLVESRTHRRANISSSGASTRLTTK
ncbi:hypothetical protein NA57DRAFT_79534 [Rhizodiscina lignyota]|uniref:Uncharacterized protein n=1 Tax=Rhizodiscina lignyota TaxID=1504668 RepID=A0A9P4I4X0_9PEZI|nr:hypothetical protein NA57DRAFT_79534 [Rhizodiscina lignyota]